MIIIHTSASSIKCVEIMITLPNFSCNNRSQIKRRADTSIPDVGSSRITIFDPPINAIPTFQDKKMIN